MASATCRETSFTDFVHGVIEWRTPSWVAAFDGNRFGVDDLCSA
jgi:hypothetical protein